MKYHLTEIFNIEELQKLCESFTNISGVVTAILDLEGNVYVATGWQPICTKFHRVNPETSKLCTESDTALAGQLESGSKYNVYRCKNGLMDVAMPIIVEGNHVGNFFTGQFFTEKPDIEFFRNQAGKYGFDESEYLAALEKVPVFSEEHMKANISFLVQLTEIVGNIGLKNLVTREQNKEQEVEKLNLKKVNDEYVALNREYLKVNQELTEAQERIQQSEETYRMLFQNLTTGFALHEIILDSEGKPCDYRFLEINPAFEALTGLKAIDLIGKTTMEVLPKTEPYWIETYGEVALTGKNINFENHSHELNKYYQVSAYSPEPGKFATIFLDITERKLAEEALRASEEDLRESQRIAHLGSWHLDIASNKVVWTEELYRMYGFDPTLPPPPFTEHQKLFTPESWDRLSDALANTTETQIPYELELETVRKDGNKGWMWVYGKTVVDANDAVVGFFGAAQDITDRKQAEETLRKSEEMTRLFFERQLVGMAITSPAKGWLRVNDRLCEMLGYSREELVATTWSELTYNEDLANDLAQFERMLAGDIDDYSLEKRFVRKDGQLVYTNLAIACVRNSDGTVDYVMALLEDITERKLAEGDIQRERCFTEAIFESIPGILYVYDDQARLVRWNKEHEMFTGYSAEELAKMTSPDWHPQEERAQVAKTVEAVMTKGYGMVEAHLLTKDGRNPLMQLNGVRLYLDGRVYFVGIGIDITERKKAEEEIYKLNAKLEQKVQDRTEELRTKNDALEQTISKLQETQSQLILFEKMTVLRHLVSGIAHEINNPLGAIDSSREMIYVNLNRLVSNISVISRWLNESDGELLAELINNADSGRDCAMSMSSREKRQIRSEVISVLTANHIAEAQEVGNLLVDLNLSEDIAKLMPLLRQKDIVEKLQIVRYILDSYVACNTIKIAVGKSSKIVNALRGYVRKDGDWDNKTLADIKEGMDIVLQLFQNTFKNFVSLELDITDNLPQIMCFPDQLNQVWTNIIQNAIHAMKNSGKLTIEAKTQDDGILVKFIDEGCGMTPQVQARIFEPLFTTKPAGEGIGLGMDIVHMIIVERHNGRIDIESTPGKGTAVSVWLPVG